MYYLKKHSIYSEFYSWTWKTDVTKFKTICPYFWRFILTIIFFPLILMIRPFINKARAVNTQRLNSKIDNVLNIILLILIGGGSVLLIIFIVFLLIISFKKALIFILAVVLLALLLFILLYSIAFLLPIINGVYHKFCPVIKWIDVK